MNRPTRILDCGKQLVIQLSEDDDNASTLTALGALRRLGGVPYLYRAREAYAYYSDCSSGLRAPRALFLITSEVLDEVQRILPGVVVESQSDNTESTTTESVGVQ